jgi:hypothetical protein
MVVPTIFHTSTHQPDRPVCKGGRTQIFFVSPLVGNPQICNDNSANRKFPLVFQSANRKSSNLQGKSIVSDPDPH